MEDKNDKFANTRLARKPQKIEINKHDLTNEERLRNKERSYNDDTQKARREKRHMILPSDGSHDKQGVQTIASIMKATLKPTAPFDDNSIIGQNMNNDSSTSAKSAEAVQTIGGLVQSNLKMDYKGEKVKGAYQEKNARKGVPKCMDKGATSEENCPEKNSTRNARNRSRSRSLVKRTKPKPDAGRTSRTDSRRRGGSRRGNAKRRGSDSRERSRGRRR